MLKHFVEFSYPGIIFSDYSHEEIAERKPELVTVPKEAFAYRFFDQVQTVVEGELLTGERKNYSRYTYFGKVYTLEEVKKEYGIVSKNNLTELQEKSYDAVVLAVPHRELMNFDIGKYKKSNGIVFDIKAVLPKNKSDGRL